jgi:AraC-like DNA-binding protein
VAKMQSRRQRECALLALRRARDQIDRHYASEIRISSMAAVAGYTTTRFIRAFRRTFGATPGQYLGRRRTERACELLRTSNLTVTEICLRVGFNSLGSFSSSFARSVGVPPTQYRKQAAARGGPVAIPAWFVLMWQCGLPAQGPAVENQLVG